MQCDDITFIGYPAIFHLTESFFITSKPFLQIHARLNVRLADLNRRAKTWLRSSLGEERLSGLSMMSLYREKLNERKEWLIEEVINSFGMKHRHLQFLFRYRLDVHTTYISN